jgi:hypothetical protein
MPPSSRSDLAFMMEQLLAGQQAMMGRMDSMAQEMRVMNFRIESLTLSSDDVTPRPQVRTSSKSRERRHRKALRTKK